MENSRSTANSKLQNRPFHRFQTPKTAYPRFWGFGRAVEQLFYIRFEQTQLRWTKEDKSFLFDPREKLQIILRRTFGPNLPSRKYVSSVIPSGSIEFFWN